MAEKNVSKVKNVVLVGQGGVGKTMLAEAMLHLTGATTRLGGHAGTKPTLDYDSQESERGFSISTTIAPITWENTRINVLDAPCYPDFVGDAYSAMSAVETALFVLMQLVDLALLPPGFGLPPRIFLSAARCSSTAWTALMQTTRPRWLCSRIVLAPRLAQ